MVNSYEPTATSVPPRPPRGPVKTAIAAGDFGRDDMKVLVHFFCTNLDGSLQVGDGGQPKKRGGIVQDILRELRPWSDPLFDYSDAEPIFWEALAKVNMANRNKTIRNKMIARSYVLTTVQNTARDFIAKEKPRRAAESLDAPIATDEEGESLLIGDVVAARRADEPDQRVFRRELLDAVREAVAGLQPAQALAFRVRVACEFETRQVDHQLIGTVLDCVGEMERLAGKPSSCAYNAHNKAYEKAKKSIRQSLVGTFGADVLAHLLHDLEIGVDLLETG